MTIPAKPDGANGVQLALIDQHTADDQEGQDGADLDQHHDVVGLGGFAHAAHQQQGQNEDDEKTRNVEICTGGVTSSPDRTGPFVRQSDAKSGELCFRVSAEAYCDGDITDCVFQDQVPTDDPGEDFSQSRVGIRVGAAGDGNHRGQLGVAQSSEAARDGYQDERDGD